MKSAAEQLSELAHRVRETSRFVHPELETKGVMGPSSPHRAPARKSFPPRNVFLSKSFPYTKGAPDPENAVHTPGTAHGAYYNIEGFGDPRRGRLSVGVAAGLVKDADWTGGTFYSELPDRWIFGDAIRTSASVTQVSELPPALAVGSHIHGIVGFSWAPMFPAADSENLLDECLSLTPGTAASALGGFVGVSAVVQVTVTLSSDSGPVSSGTAEMTLLSAAVDAEFYGSGVQDAPPAPFLFLDFAFAGNPWQVIELDASAPFVYGAKEVAIETSVTLAGGRGGINDPNGGWVTAAFMDLYEGASPVAYLPPAPNPFLVRGVTAFSAPS